MKGKKSILNEIANFDAIEQGGGLTSELLVQRALRKGESNLDAFSSDIGDQFKPSTLQDSPGLSSRTRVELFKVM